MKKILITGANGFFATRLISFYKNKYDMIALKREQLDVTDENKTIRIIKDTKPDYVIHTAAIANTDICEKNPDLAYNINVKGTINIVKGCEITGSKLIFASSEQVYNGNEEPGPYSEQTIPVPNTQYGKNKLQSEENIKNLYDKYWILRFTWMFSFPERNCTNNANIIWSTLESLLKGEKIKASPFEFRGMTYVYNVIENIEKIMDIPYGIYNTGCMNNMSRYDVVKYIIKNIGLENKIDNIDSLVIMDDKYKDKNRDLRISNDKLNKFGIIFPDTCDSILQCLKDFNFYLK